MHSSLKWHLLLRGWCSLAFLLLSLLSSPSSFAGDPSIHWRVLSSDHFELIYDENYKDQAKVFLRAFETARSLLTPAFSEAPDKTTVLIQDVTDSSNGFASFLPYPLIVLYPVLPENAGVLSHYDHWALELAIHEYTHILSMYPSHGVFRPLRWIFGNIMRPNAILPRWFLEGVAVEMESRWTTHGRLRNPATSALIRALIEDERWGKEDIARINEVSIPSFPYGNRPYFYGSLLWKELTSTYGLESVEYLHQRFSRRIPFQINGPVEDLTEKNWKQLLHDLYLDYYKRGNEQLDTIRKAGDDASDRPDMKLPNTSVQTAMSLSPDFKRMVVSNADPYDGESLMMYEKSESKESFREAEHRRLLTVKNPSRVSWLPDSSGFIFDQYGTWKAYYQFQDLYIYRLSNKKTERLTRGERASQPAVSPNGEKVIYVRNEGAKTQLKILDLTSKETSLLLERPMFERISHPEFISNEEAVFVGRDLTGKEILYKIYVLSKETESLLSEFDGIAQPRWTKKGLLFTSSKTGVRNLYLADRKLASAVPVSNTTTGVLQGDYDMQAKELWTSRFSGFGPRLYASQKTQIQKPPEITPLVEPA
ncbi:MAG: hypothetical protein KDD22_07450, partial [Bdellovibrionales bacterium]|nr:hypothetical protein [Bdellovibrionales bacterium]